MSHTLHVAIYNTWADWEAGFALAHLGSGDWSSPRTSYEIRLVGESPEPIVTKAGITLTPDMVLADPPYTSRAPERLAALWLEDPFSRILCIEHASDRPLPRPGKRRVFGDTMVTTYRIRKRQTAR